MILKQTNNNYCATVVAISKLIPLAKCDNVQGAIIMGNQVIVGKDVKIGDVGVFFPIESALSAEFLANNNLYNKPELGNLDQTKKGFFEYHGRVKAVRFRGHKSEGFWIPISSLAYLGIENLLLGAEFNQIETADGIHDICKKYVSRKNHVGGEGSKKRNDNARKPKLEDKLVENQFRFHIDTNNLRKNIHCIDPDDIITITDKWHGTSAVYANILVKRDLNWFEKVLDFLGLAKIQKEQYGTTWSSRKVLKGVNGATKDTANHFYSEDIWSVVAQEVLHKIPAGYTVYGEIVGYTPNGSPIQSFGSGIVYDYGCAPGTYKFKVYRVTYTNYDGEVLELNWDQIENFCLVNEFEHVPVLYHGNAWDYVERNFEFENDEQFQEEFLRILEERVQDRKCIYNQGLPAEGVVVKIDSYDADFFKLKSFEFLNLESKALDFGDEADIETAESLGDENEN